MKKIIIFSTLFFVIVIMYVFVVHMLLVNTAKEKPPAGISHIIIPGAKLNGDVMSLSLLYRVKAALEYLKENDHTKVVVSGGQGEDEWITEAEAMERYLLDNGISRERIIKEEQSTTTNENISFSRDKIGDEVKEIIVVTNDFHLYRSMVIAKRQGFIPYPLAAETPRVVKEKLWMREYVAVLKTWLFDW